MKGLIAAIVTLCILLLLFWLVFFTIPSVKTASNSSHLPSQEEEPVASKENDRKEQVLYFAEGELLEIELTPTTQFDVIDGCFRIEISRNGEIQDFATLCAREERKWKQGTHIKFAALEKAVLDLTR